MRDYEEHYRELRKEYAKIDTSDLQSIRDWFDKYHYLTTSELARVAGKSRWHIRYLRRKAGIKISSRTTSIKPKRQLPSISYIEVPPDWRTNKQWLTWACRNHPIVAIARAAGCSKPTLYKYIRKNGVVYPRGQIQRKNPCFNKGWLYKHYVDMGLNQPQCAKLAGVTVETIGCWLIQSGITTRRSFYATTYPPWVYKLTDALEQVPIVRVVYYRHDHVHVRFRHFIWESYYIDRTKPNQCFSRAIFQDDAKLEDIPPVTFEYESNLDGSNDFPHHLYVDSRRMREASLLERRMALHTFGNHIFHNKYQQLTHPDHVLRRAWETVKSADYKRLIRSDNFVLYYVGSGLDMGTSMKISEHFFDLQAVWAEIFYSPRYITLALDSVSKSASPLSTHNMLMFAISRRYQMKHKPLPRMTPSSIYMAILKKLNIHGPVLDMYTGYGGKAMACALLGVPYYYVQNEHFDNALRRGFGDFIGVECRPHNGEKVSLLICDYDLRKLPDMDGLERLAKYASNMLIFVPGEHRDNMLRKLPPRATLPIKPQINSDAIDYLFLY